MTGVSKLWQAVKPELPQPDEPPSGSYTELLIALSRLADGQDVRKTELRASDLHSRPSG